MAGVEAERRIVLRDLSWETYEALLADHESASAPRFTYDRGELQIMSPMPMHEVANRSLASLVEIVAVERDIEFVNLGSTTFYRQDLERGFDPDTCFFIQNAQVIRGEWDIIPLADPPPDLVIEIAFTSPHVNKMAVFAAFHVPEVWRFDGRRMTILILDDAEYVPVSQSLALPGVTAADVSAPMAGYFDSGRIAWLRRVRDWAKNLPRE